MSAPFHSSARATCAKCPAAVAVNGARVVARGQQTIAGGTMPLTELSADGGATFKPAPSGRG